MDLPLPVDDLTLLDSDLLDSGRLDAVPVEAAIARQHRRELAGSTGRLIVVDHRLAALARTVGDRPPIQVGVINTGGAGGLLGLERRSPAGLQIAAVESAIRDLDDPAGNAGRIVAAAAALSEIEVFVGLPYATGWERAAEVVEAAGFSVALSGAGAGLLEQVSGLIELDCPFSVRMVERLEPWALLSAVEALIEDATVAEAMMILNAPADPIDRDHLRQARLTRRISRLGTADLAVVPGTTGPRHTAP